MPNDSVNPDFDDDDDDDDDDDRPPAGGAATSERRDRYLDAAMGLFTDFGYDGTTTDMIVAEVGGSKATLYKYFPSKAALVAGLIDRASSTITRPLLDPDEADLPLADALRAIARSACEGVWSPAAIAAMRLSVAEVGRFPELARTVWELGPRRTYARFADFLAEREANGEIHVPDAQLAAEQFIGGTVGHVQMRIAFGMSDIPDDDSITERVESAVATFLARYAA